MSDELLTQNESHWEIGLDPDAPGTPSLSFVARGQQETQARRDYGSGLRMAQQLIAVIQREITQPGTNAFGVLHRNRVADLMANTAQRPLLGKAELPVTAVGTLEGADVLNDPALLVVRLFEEKAIVLDLTGQRRSASTEKGVRDQQ